MAGKAVERKAPELPALVDTPSLGITADDVAVPRIHIGQFMSKAVQNTKETGISAGDLYFAVGQEDPEPVILDPPVKFHVLALRKGKSYSDDGGPLERYDYDDPDAPAGAWVTYDYTVFLPEVDASVPFKVLLTRTGLGTARQLNTIIRRTTEPFFALAFHLSVAERENTKGRFWIPVVRQIEADPSQASAAGEMLLSLSDNGMDSAGASATDQPDI